MAEALYRKYRPRTFAEMVGQEVVERTIKNAVSQDKVSHAYLFCGPRGTGKTTSARLLSKALLCEQGPTPTPDGTCAQCEDIARGVHPDVYELDAASRTGVENVREEIISRVAYAPTRGRYKIYIIDEVHMLSTAAFNALLKTLEEPPAHVVFVLCTTDPQKVPDTILSRCQRFDFKRISAADIAGRLAVVCEAEGVSADPEALDLLAAHARGGMRDALTALEATIAHDGGAVTVEGAREVIGEGGAIRGSELLEAVAVRDVVRCFTWVAEAADAGVDLSSAAAALAADIRDLYVMAVVGDTRNAAGFGMAPARVEALRRVSGAFPADRAARALAVLGDALSDMKGSANQRLTLEIALTRLARPDEDNTLDALAERVSVLEAGGLRAAAPAVAAAPVAAPAPAPAPAPVPAAPAQPQAHTAPASRPVQPAVAPAPRPQVAAPASTPAPAQAAAPVAAAPAGTITEAKLKSTWPAIVAQLKKVSPASCAMFLTATPRVTPAGEIQLVFPADKGFAYQTAQNPQHANNFAAALTKALGMQVPFSMSLDGAATAAPAAAPRPIPRPAAPAPVPAPARTPAAAAPTAPTTPAAAAAPAPARTPVAAPTAPTTPALVTPAPAPVSAASKPVPTVAPATEPPAVVTSATPEAPVPDPNDVVPYDDEYVPYEEEDTFASSSDDAMADFFAGFGATFEEVE